MCAEILGHCMQYFFLAVHRQWVIFADFLDSSISVTSYFLSPKSIQLTDNLHNAHDFCICQKSSAKGEPDRPAKFLPG